MGHRITRRDALRVAAALPLLPSNARQGGNPPADVPAGIAAVIKKTLAQPPGSLNTDWFGTTLMQGLLEWHRRGTVDVRAFSQSWLAHHLQSGKLSKFSGAKSREVVAGGIHLTTYAGHFGMAFPCYEMAIQFDDQRARHVCVEVGKFILHKTARNRFGMVEHDDSGEFAIPDTCYFVVRALMSASALAGQSEQDLREQAVFQLQTYVDTFLSKDRGLAKTVLFRHGLGSTYWTRASGWLLWAITSVLRLLPRSDPAFPGFVGALERLAAGMAKVQHSSGGFRVLLDDDKTPLETTGTAMFASGIHESVRNGWLPESYRPAARRAWDFVKGNIAEDGTIRNAYTGWAMPAESREMSIDEFKMEWIPGFILMVGNEMLSGAVG